MKTSTQAARFREAVVDLARNIETIDGITRLTNTFSMAEFDEALSRAREATLGALGHAYEQLAELAIRQAQDERRDHEAAGQ